MPRTVLRNVRIGDTLVPPGGLWPLDALVVSRPPENEAMSERPKLIRYSELDPEHKDEVLRNLDRRQAARTVWEFVPAFPADEAAALAWDVSVMVRDSRVESVKAALEAGGKVRPVLIDELDERNAWMEGIHRAIAASELGMQTIPVLFRVK